MFGRNYLLCLPIRIAWYMPTALRGLHRLVGRRAELAIEYTGSNPHPTVPSTSPELPQMNWTERFWARLTGEQPSLRFTLYYRRREDLRLPVEVVAGEPRVPVNAEVLALLDRVDQNTLFQRVTDERQRRAWQLNSATTREGSGRTVSLYAAVVAALVPLGATKRATMNLNVYSGLQFKVDELRQLVDADVREALAPLRRPFASAYDIAPLLGIETPRSGADEDAPEGERDEAPEPEPQVVAEVPWDQHHNLIFFGPPGTGKSWQLQQIVASHLRAGEEDVFRVTFHPEYTYFDFVGSYKPRVGWMKSLNDFKDADSKSHVNREPRVYYAFDPGPFSRALLQSFLAPTRAVVVIVEEINRGNCAAIFGDVFQLLDRASDGRPPEERGRSEYPVVPNAEWKAWLDQAVPEGTTACWKNGRLRLPSNLYIYATMNTSDQSLFPMDTAFRRRWGLQFVGVETTSSIKTRVRLNSNDREGVPWMAFARTVNEEIVAHTRSDDKQVGPWFVQRAAGETTFVSDVQFKSKVLFYLWSEVFRDATQKIFHSAIRTYDQLVRKYSDGETVFAESFLRKLGGQE